MNIHLVKDIGWFGTIDREQHGQYESGGIYAVASTREECMSKLERVVVAFKDYDWNGPLGGWGVKT